MIEILRADDAAHIDLVAARLHKALAKVWLDEKDRFVWLRAFDVVLREINRTRWLTYLGEFRLTLCPADRIAGLAVVPFGERRVRAVGLCELERTDPEVGRVLARTRELLTAGG